MSRQFCVLCGWKGLPSVAGFDLAGLLNSMGRCDVCPECSYPILIDVEDE